MKSCLDLRFAVHSSQVSGIKNLVSDSGEDGFKKGERHQNSV